MWIQSSSHERAGADVSSWRSAGSISRLREPPAHGPDESGLLRAARPPVGRHPRPECEPSATDFLVFELPAIVEAFATRFDELPEAVEGVPDARMAIGTGKLVRAFAVYGLLMADDSVELIGVEIDLDR